MLLPAGYYTDSPEKNLEKSVRRKGVLNKILKADPQVTTTPTW